MSATGELFIDMISKLTVQVQQDGGFTARIDDVTGEIEFLSEGIAVALPEYSRSYGPEHDVFDAINDYACTVNIAGAMHSRPAFGAWRDSETGILWLDTVEIFTDREAAITAGRERNQIAIFDLATFEEIPTGGTGEAL